MNSPNVNVTFYPEEGNAIVYHPTPGWTSKDDNRAQISIKIKVANNETVTLTWKKIVISYKVNGIKVSRQFLPKGGDPPTFKKIAASKSKSWQNSRKYHKTGDVIYIGGKIPSKLDFELFFEGFPNPVSISKNLKPFSKAFQLPFKSSDLKKDEYYIGGSTHGGGSQVFAYDFGVYGYSNGKWSRNLPGTDGSENHHKRVWGKKIYAMAAGEVISFANDVKGNPKPGEREPDTGGGGNYFKIRHGNYIILYAHMQEDSLNKNLLSIGHGVKKGEFLGLAGNSGSSSGPHGHFHLVDEGDGQFRPLIFENGYVIGTKKYTEPFSNVNWSALKKQGIPGLAGSKSLIYPGTKHPYCKYPKSLKQIGKHGISENKYQSVVDKIWTCGFYPYWIDAYNVNGKTYFNVLFRPSTGAKWASKHGMSGSSYQKQFDKFKKAGYRLTLVDSYISKVKVRYVAIWIKTHGPATYAYHGALPNWHGKKFKELTAKGWVPVNVSCISIGDKRKITALYEKKNVGGFKLKSLMTLGQYQDQFDKYKAAGYELVYINGYTHNDKPRLSGIWYKNPPFKSYSAKHNLTSAAYQAEYTKKKAKGWLTRCVTGYENGSSRFAALWTK